jgi:sarcosine oxidase
MGPWNDTAVPVALAPLFTIVRQTLVWFDVPSNMAAFDPSRCPVHIWALEGNHDIYGFPAVNGPSGGVKIASEQYAESTTADTVRRDVTDAETSELYERFVAPCFPSVSSRVLRTATCLYTVTPNFDFIIDTLPDQPQVMIVSPCSGHGFKHSAAIGESVASLVRDEVPHLSLDAFRGAWHRKG